MSEDPIIEELKSEHLSPSRALELYHDAKSAVYRPLLAKNPSTPLELLLLIGEEHPRAFLENPIFPLLLLEHPDALQRWPERLIQSIVACELAPGYLVLQAAKHRGNLVRAAVASNRSLTPELLHEMAADPHGMVVTQVASNPNTEPETLEQLATHTGSVIRAAVAKHPRASAALQERLSTDPEFAVRLASASHPMTPAHCLPKLMADIYPQIRAAARARPDAPTALKTLLAAQEADPCAPLSPSEEEELCTLSEYSASLIARRPSTSPAQLLRLTKSRSMALHEITANPSAPPEALEIAAQNPYLPIQKNIAAHPNTPVKLLASMLTSEYKDVRTAARRNPNAPTKTLALLWRAGADNSLAERATPQTLLENDAAELLLSRYGRELLAVHPQSSAETLLQIVQRRELYDEIAAHPNASLEVLQQLAQYSPRQVAAHPRAGPLLVALAESKLRGVRCMVAKHPQAPLEALQKLSTDWCREIRFAVAKNKNTSATLCALFAKDADWLIRRAAARHPATPSRIVESLALDPDPRVKSSALVKYQKLKTQISE